MSQQHTPGPWSVNEVFGTVEGPRGQEICAIHPADESGRREPRSTAQANARFICTAVNSHADLLEALRAFVEQYAKLAGFPDLTSPYSGAFVAARAAIAKAEGGAA